MRDTQMASVLRRLAREAGGRSWRSEERTAGTTRPLRVAQADDDALRIVVSRSHRDAATEAWLTRHAAADFRAAGSSLKFCPLAGGEAALYPRLSRTMEWDTAATDAVLRAAGQ